MHPIRAQRFSEMFGPLHARKSLCSQTKRFPVQYHFVLLRQSGKNTVPLRDALRELPGLLNERCHIPNPRCVSGWRTTGWLSSSPWRAFLTALQPGISTLHPGGFERPRGDLASHLQYLKTGLFPVYASTGSVMNPRRKIPSSSLPQLVERHRTASLRALAKEYGVSYETVRRSIESASQD